MNKQQNIHPQDISRNLVSVIIPCYHQAYFLPTAIQSCIDQTYQKIEIIIVDDGSPDNVQMAVMPFKDRIKLIQQTNQGLSEARNVGIRHSSGDFLLFLDADDILGSDTVSSQIKYLKENTDTNVVVCKNYLFTSVTPQGVPEITGRWELFQKDLGIHLCFLNIAPPHAFLSRRETILQTGWFDPQLKACEDYDFWLRAAVNGNIPRYNPIGAVYYRRHSKSMSTNIENQYLHDAILHNRLSKLLDLHPQFLFGKRFEALLAFCSGALLTASRLHGLNLIGANELIDLAFKKIADANNIARSSNTTWNVLSKLFYLRIISYLAYPGVKDSALKDGIIENLRDIMTAIKAPSSKFGLVVNLLSTIVMGSDQYIIERTEIKRMAKTYLKNRILSNKLND